MGSSRSRSGRIRRPMDYPASPSTHPGIVLLLDGEFTFVCDGQEIAAEAGSYLLVQPGTPHCYVRTRAEAVC